MMLNTENLHRHLDDLEHRRTDAFFNVHALAHRLSHRLYTYNLFIAIVGVILFAINRLTVDTHNAYFLQWSTVLSVAATVIAIFHYLFILDRSAVKIHRSACAIMNRYDDEYIILKKYTAGHIDEPMIRQFYVGAASHVERYGCTMAQPTIVSWIATAFLFAALMLSIIA